MSVRSAALLAMALSACSTASAPPVALGNAGPSQKAWAATCEDFDEWDKPGPPFRLYGETYYVGTCGITALLVAGPDGHVLIDTGTDEGARTVLANIAALGFDPLDVDFILISHEHFDHVGGIARIQQETGATILATSDAAQVLRTGQVSAEDPQARSDHPPFPPVPANVIVELDRERPQQFGGTTFHPMFTPGHTPGAMSWRWQACEDGACKWVVYADSLNPISSDGYRFSDRPVLVAGFRDGVAKVAAAPCDIALAPHPGAVALRARLRGDKPLFDPLGCKTFAATAAGRMDKRLADEAGG